MNRTTLNFWLDLTLLCLFSLLVGCSVIVHYVFPLGTQAAGWSIWGWSYNDWCMIQFGILCTLALGVLIHVTLHWTWVMGVIGGYQGRRRGRKRVQYSDGSRTLIGVSTLVVLLHLVAAGVAAAALMLRGPAP